MLALTLAVVAGLVAGAVVALKVIAPKTKTTKDDALLAFLEKFVLPFLPADKAEAAKEAALKLPAGGK